MLSSQKWKKIRGNFVSLTVWRAPEINLEAAKAAETTLLITSTAESWPYTELAAVSEQLQSQSNASWAGATVTKSMSEGWHADLLKCRCRYMTYPCMHSHTAHISSCLAQNADFDSNGVGGSEKTKPASPQWLLHTPFQIAQRAIQTIAIARIHK